jgi:diguanylate cyclase (GGDEF)-like protein
VRRLREGIYTQPISIPSRDEFGDLAEGFNSMQEAIANRERHIFHMAHHDSLSGLPTRDIVVGRLRDTLGEVEHLAVLNICLTRFDGLASSLGHRVADRVIELVAGQLRSGLEEHQILGHLNHQEFVLVLPGFGRDEAEAFARRLKSMLRAGVKVGDANISLQATAGLAMYPEHGDDAAELLRLAAIARNDGSHHVESVVTYQREQEDRALQLIRIVGDFPRALQNQELELEFQPQVDCNHLSLIGAEALVRWQHPELGRLAPDVFIEAIEQAGGISHLTRWVIREAVRCCAAWRSSGLDIPVAVNISADDLVDEYLPRFLSELTARHGLAPQAVTLEVTESEIIRDVHTSLAIVTCLRDLGFRVAIDDFGTGHSSLAQLKRLPVDELKIDKSFVLNMSNRRDEAVVRAAIELAHQFGLTVLAEGVENESSLARLRQLGCESAQGYHFGRPMPQHEFLRWAASWAETEGSDIVSLVGAGAEA